jgi:hypothetical protein
MSDSKIFYMPVEFGLELMAIMGPHCMDTEGELLYHIVDKINGLSLGVLLADLQGPDAGSVINGGILKPSAPHALESD